MFESLGTAGVPEVQVTEGRPVVRRACEMQVRVLDGFRNGGRLACHCTGGIGRRRRIVVDGLLGTFFRISFGSGQRVLTAPLVVGTVAKRVIKIILGLRQGRLGRYIARKAAVLYGTHQNGALVVGVQLTVHPADVVGGELVAVLGVEGIVRLVADPDLPAPDDVRTVGDGDQGVTFLDLGGGNAEIDVGVGTASGDARSGNRDDFGSVFPDEEGAEGLAAEAFGDIDAVLVIGTAGRASVVGNRVSVVVQIVVEEVGNGDIRFQGGGNHVAGNRPMEGRFVNVPVQQGVTVNQREPVGARSMDDVAVRRALGDALSLAVDQRQVHVLVGQAAKMGRVGIVLLCFRARGHRKGQFLTVVGGAAPAVPGTLGSGRDPVGKGRGPGSTVVCGILEVERNGLFNAAVAHVGTVALEVGGPVFVRCARISEREGLQVGQAVAPVVVRDGEAGDPVFLAAVETDPGSGGGLERQGLGQAVVGREADGQAVGVIGTVGLGQGEDGEGERVILGDGVAARAEVDGDFLVVRSRGGGEAVEGGDAAAQRACRQMGRAGTCQGRAFRRHGEGRDREVVRCAGRAVLPLDGDFERGEHGLVAQFDGRFRRGGRGRCVHEGKVHVRLEDLFLDRAFRNGGIGVILASRERKDRGSGGCGTRHGGAQADVAAHARRHRGRIYTVEGVLTMPPREPVAGKGGDGSEALDFVRTGSGILLGDRIVAVVLARIGAVGGLRAGDTDSVVLYPVDPFETAGGHPAGIAGTGRRPVDIRGRRTEGYALPFKLIIEILLGKAGCEQGGAEYSRDDNRFRFHS